MLRVQRKTCSKCHKRKRVTQFPRNRRKGHGGDGYYCWCKKCTNAARSKHYYSHIEQERARWKLYNYRSHWKKNRTLKYRSAVFKLYGRKCVCCGETHEVFLSIDHLHGGGHKHRGALGLKGDRWYAWLLQYRRPGFQTLCRNCNWAKYRGGCPHQKEKA